MMHYFKSLLLRGFIELKKHYEYIIRLVEIMSISTEINCFKDSNNNNLVINAFKERFYFQKSEKELLDIIDKMVEVSFDNWRTNYYDKFQLLTNGILP
jgi:phosphatidylinositol 4-kinase B